jgi:hypothetical protein
MVFEAVGAAGRGVLPWTSRNRPWQALSVSSDPIASQISDGRWWLEMACRCGRVSHIKVIDLAWHRRAETLGDLVRRLLSGHRL